MKQRFQAIVAYFYEVDTEDPAVVEAYGTDDPDRVANIDAIAFAEDPQYVAETLSEVDTYLVDVKPLDE